jgi:hypothetical protein
MAISDGQKVNALNSNAAWVSRTSDSNTVGKLDLENTDVASGDSVINAQKEHNSSASYTGKTVGTTKDDVPTYSSDAVGIANEDLTARAGALTAQVGTNVTGIATNVADIAANASDVADIRTTTGTVDGDTDMGAMTGTVLTSNTTAKANIQELGTQVDTNTSDIATITSSPVFTFQGNYDVVTNTPTLVDGTGTIGHSYKLTTAGTRDFGAGNISFIIGDLIYYSGTVWDKDKEPVASVAGKQGVVTLVAADVTDFDTEVTNNTTVVANTSKVSASGSIDEHSDVDITTIAPTLGQAPIWDGTKFVPGDAGGGSGQGGINYITNPDFETDLTGWSLYKDAAASTPVDGTGGTALEITSTASVVVADVLRGTQSLKLNSSGSASAQGEGISYDFAIDNIDQGGKLNLSFEYETPNASYNTGDFQVFIYDIDNATLLGRVRSDENGGIINNIGSPGTFRGDFETTNSANYRLIIHCTVPFLYPQELRADNFKIGPEQFGPGAIVTEWEAYTPTTQGFGTVSSVDCWWRRVGSNYELSIDFNTGTNTATEAQVGLPNGKVVKSGISPSSKSLGSMATSYGAAIDLNVLATSGDAFLNMGREDTATSGLVALNGNTLGNTVDVSFTVSVPIEGLAASNLVSTTETLFSSAKTQLNITSNQTVSSTSPTKIAFDSVIFDATGASDIGNSRILILKSGYYLINAHCYMNGVTSTDLMTLSIYKNGVSLYRSLDNAESATVTLTSSRVVLLAKGDYIEAFIDSQTDASYTVVGGTNDSFLEVTYQQDFSVFGVFGETAYVEAKSSTSAGWAFTSNTYGVITSIVVDPGEQVLEFSVIGQTTAANGVYDIRAAIDTVGGTSAPTLNYADNAMFDVYTNVSFEVKTLTLTGYRVNPAVATTYYLKGFVNGNISNQNLTAYKFSARKFK